jgi:hypothetical protein
MVCVAGEHVEVTRDGRELRGINLWLLLLCLFQPRLTSRIKAMKAFDGALLYGGTFHISSYCLEEQSYISINFFAREAPTTGLSPCASEPNRQICRIHSISSC